MDGSWTDGASGLEPRELGRRGFVPERHRPAWTSRAPKPRAPYTDTGRLTVDTLTQDLRYALRSLRRSRGVTLAAVLTLGLGMGASTAVFALLKRAVLDPLPYHESSRLVRFKNRVSGVGPGVEWD